MLKINDVNFAYPLRGSYSKSYSDDTNDNKSDTGVTVVNEIRKNVLTIEVNYKGLLADEYNTYVNALDLINTVSDTSFAEKTMKRSKYTSNRVGTRTSLEIWDLSFTLVEL